MAAKDIIRQTLQSADTITDRYLADLSDADLMVRPCGEMNHIAWQLGHLIAADRMFLETIKPGAAPALPEGFEEAHSKEAATSDDPSKFRTKDEYLRLRDAQREAMLASLDAMTEDQLDAASPERWRGMVPTMGGLFNFAGSHWLMHVGQFVGTRRKVGKPIVI